MADPSSLLGPLDALAPFAGVLALLFVVVNMVTRMVAHRKHTKQADDGADAVSRFLPHELTNVLLLLSAFYYMTVHYHGGMVLSAVVVTLVVTDFFEFEARKVEARKEEPLDRPKAALAASMLALVYALFQTAFFVVAPVWNALV